MFTRDDILVGLVPFDTLSLAQAARDPSAFVDGPVSLRALRREARERLGTRSFSILALRAGTLAVIRRQVAAGQYTLARSNLRFLASSRRPKAADLPIPPLP